MEKKISPHEFSRLADETCRKLVEDFVKKRANREDREPCIRQVFADLDAAVDTARALLPLGIHATPEKCPICGLIHLLELREH